jgi:iron(III) transport system ATP-binding protein
LIPGQVLAGGRIDSAIGIMSADFIKQHQVGDSVELLLRPDDIVHDDESEFKLEIVGKIFQGAEYLYTLALDEDTQLLCLVQSHHDHGIGERIGVRLDVDHVVAFPT